MLHCLHRRRVNDTASVHVLTDISADNIVTGSTDIAALLYLMQNVSHVRLTYLPQLHAKVYISNIDTALVGSANFTDGGARRNHEYGVEIRDAAMVKSIHADLNRYAELGGSVNMVQLESLQTKVENVREAVKGQQSSIRKQLLPLQQELNISRKPSVFSENQLVTHDLLDLRLQGKTRHAIFSETLLFLLKAGPQRTTQLYERIQELHADLCDDAVYRVFKGRQYPTKWKHQVRAAQNGLQRNGKIKLDKDTGLWRLA